MRVLEQFSFAEVPETEAQRIVDRVSGTEVHGHPLRLETTQG